MAARNYPVGNDTNNITLEIKVGSPAGWTAKVFKPIPPASSGQFTVLAKSNVEDGVVKFPESPIGTGKDLRDVQLVVEIIGDFRDVTDIDVSKLQSDNQFLRNAFFVSYMVRGGSIGEQDLDYDNDDFGFSTDGEIIVIDKHINFI